MNSVNSSLKRFAHSVGQNWYHVVLVPKGRFAVFQWVERKEVADKAFEWVCKRHRIDVFTKEVMPNHVHLFVACPPSYSIRKLVAILKGGSSYFIRKEFPSLRKYKHLWSRGMMYRSVGNVSAETIKKYIEESNDWEKARRQF